VDNKNSVTQFYTNGFASNSISLQQEYSYLNTFNKQSDFFGGVSTLFSPIIDISGPGIISLVLQEVASYLMANVIMPIIITMSGFSISDLVNSIFGQDIYQAISDFQTIFSFVASGELDLLSAAVNGIGSFTGSMIEGLLNWYVEVVIKFS
jgi:hypothetical protein